MEVGIRVEAENTQTRTARHTNSCYFSMVAVDQAGEACACTAFWLWMILLPNNATNGKKRKELRIKLQQHDW